MIKSAINELMPVYLKLFSTVLRSGIMPQAWCNGIITPTLKVVLKVIHQTTVRVEFVFPVVLKNYSVHFSTRLLDHVKSRDILHKAQIGFVANNRTSETMS